MRAPSLFRDTFSEEEGLDLTPEEASHLLGALRFEAGKIITLKTPQAHYTCKVIQIQNHHLELQIEDMQPITPSLNIELHLIQGLPKQDKFSDIIRMCTEIGVHTLHPVESRRSIAKLSGKELKKSTRWELIVQSANQQSQRLHPAKIAEPLTLGDFLSSLPPLEENELRLVAWEQSKEPLKATLTKIDPFQKATKIWIFIGPEGGLAPEEIKKAKLKGFHPMSLGKTILRTEHAGFATLAQLLFAYS